MITEKFGLRIIVPVQVPPVLHVDNYLPKQHHFDV